MLQLDNFKTLNIWVLFKNKCVNSEDIISKIWKGRIGCLNSLWLDKNISVKTKNGLGKAMVE